MGCGASGQVTLSVLRQNVIIIAVMLARLARCCSHRTLSILVLVAFAVMFFASSCGGVSLQFDTTPFVSAAEASCEEHVLQEGEIHTEESIFASVVVPQGEVFFSAVIVAVLFVFSYLPLKEVGRYVKTVLGRSRKRRWVWARGLPFSSFAFLPYFAAQRDG